MSHKIEIAAESTYASPDAGGYVDVSGLTFLSCGYEIGTRARTIEPERGQPRRGCGPAIGAAGFSIGPGAKRRPGTFEFERPLVSPGAGGDWTSTVDWLLLRSWMGDSGAPGGTTDTITGVSAKEVTPATVAQWKSGDFLAVELNTQIQIRRVTDISGGNLILDKALTSVPAGGTAVRQCRYLYYNGSGSIGSSLAVKDHGDDTLWIGAGVRGSGAEFRRGADGRMLIKHKLVVGVWEDDHTSADNSCDGDDCGDVGEHLSLDNIRATLSDDYTGVTTDGTVGSLTAAPFNAASLTAMLLEDVSAVVTVAAARRQTIGNRIGVTEIALGDMTTDITLKASGYIGDLNGDTSRNPPRRILDIPLGPLGQTTGGALWYGAAQVNSIPDDLPEGEIVDEQTITLSNASWCGCKATATDGGAARPGYDASFCIVLVL